MKTYRNIAALVLAAALVPWVVAKSSQASAPASQSSKAEAVKLIGTPRLEDVEDTTAQVAWSTNVKSSAIVHYGTDPKNLSQTAEEPWGGDTNKWTTVHRVKIQGLQPNTTYYYQVESGQALGTGTETKGEVQSFKTVTHEAAVSGYREKQRDIAKIKVGPVIRNVKDTAADVWWMTPSKISATVKYGTSASSLTQTAQATASGNEYSANLAGLQPNTTYYFEIASSDGKELTKGQFQTESSDVASNPNQFRITGGPNVEFVGQNKAIVAWSTNRRSSSIVRYGSDPNNLTQTAQAPWGGNPHRVTITGLKPNTDYFFVVESSQAEGTGQAAKSQPAPFETVAPGESAMNAAPFLPNQ